MQYGNLKKLIILRHAPYEGRGFVTAEGQELIKKLADKIRGTANFSAKNTVVLCSRELRAIKTAQSLQKALGVEGDHERIHAELFSNDRQCDYVAAITTVVPYCEHFEYVIVVTHLEMTPLLARACGNEILGINGFFVAQGNYLQGYLLDYRTKTCTPIKP